MNKDKCFLIIENIIIEKSKKNIKERYSARYPYFKESIKKSKNLTFIPIIYTPIYLKKLGQVGHFLINLSGFTSLPVIYNSPFSPSINLSALGQTLFQRACFIGELFGKGKEFEVNGLELPGTGAQKR